MKQIPTLYSNYQELMLDLDIFGKIISTPQQSIQEMKDALFEEFKLRKPLPTLTDKRYELSEQVSQDYRIAYNKELEMQDYESLVDLESKSDLVKDFSFEDLTPLVPKVKALFSYEQNIKDIDRKNILEKYSMETGEEFTKGIAQTEELFNSVKEDKSLILSDSEIDNLGKDLEDEDSDEEEYVGVDESDEDDYIDETSFEEEDSDEDDSNEDEEDLDGDEDDSNEEKEDFDEVEEEEDFDENLDEKDDENFDEDEDDYLDETDFEDSDDEDYPDETSFEEEDSDEDEDSDEEDEDSDEEDEDSDDDDEDEDYPDETNFEDPDEDAEEEEDSDEDEEDSEDDSSTEDSEDDEDFEIEFDESAPQINNVDESPPIIPKQVNIPITPVEINNNIVKEEVVDRSLEPTDIRQFLRKHPRSDYDFVLKYFTKKQINDALKIGKIIKKGNILKLP